MPAGLEHAPDLGEHLAHPQVAGGELQRDDVEVIVGKRQLVHIANVALDADNDGMVSKTEFMNYMSAEFDNLDVNKAGGNITVAGYNNATSNAYAGIALFSGSTISCMN